MTMKVLYHGARIILGVVFIYASFHKILYPAAFANAVFNYQILPDALINITALILPWLELIVGIMLLLNVWMSGAVVIVNALLVSFTSAIIFNMARGLDIACGCFTTTSTENGMTLLTVLRDSLLLIVSLFLLYSTFIRRANNPAQTSAADTITCNDQVS